MEQQYVTLLAGLGGALIGAAASIATVTVQAHYQARRERMRVAVEAGIEGERSRGLASKAPQRG
jgi:hypothetical protein